MTTSNNNTSLLVLATCIRIKSNNRIISRSATAQHGWASSQDFLKSLKKRDDRYKLTPNGYIETSVCGKYETTVALA